MMIDRIKALIAKATALPWELLYEDDRDDEDSEEVVTPVAQDPSIEYIETIDDHGIKTRIPAPTN
jgi:hypothetical protein